MKRSTTRALFVTPLVPLVGIGAVAFCAHSKDQDTLTSLGAAVGFALIWAIFIYPIGVVGGFCAHWLLSALKCSRKWHYLAVWFFAGAALVGAWFSGLAFSTPEPGKAGGLLWVLGLAFVGGVANGIGGLTFWSLAVRNDLSLHAQEAQGIFAPRAR